MHRVYKKRCWPAFVVCLVVVAPVQGDVKNKTVREIAEYLMSKFGKEVAKDGLGSVMTRIERLAVRHGDEILVAVGKTGPVALKVVEDAGSKAAPVIKLLAQHGEDGLWVVAHPVRSRIFLTHGHDAAAAMIRHKAIAEPLIESFAQPAARALNAINGQNARRLRMMVDDGDLARLAKPRELLDVIARHGDRAMEFVWRNKGALAITAALTAFVVNPEPFLNGTRQLIGDVVRPVAEAPGRAVMEAARRTDWTTVFLATLGTLAVLAAWKTWLRCRPTPQCGVGRSMPRA